MINFHNLSEDSYFSQRYSLLKNVEEGGVPKLISYVDSKGIPTIGIGMNLRVGENINKIIDKVLTNFPLLSEDNRGNLKVPLNLLLIKSIQFQPQVLKQE